LVFPLIYPTRRNADVVAMSSNRITTLAIHACRAIRAVRGEHEAWVELDRLIGQPGLESRTEVDAAAAFAAAKGWLAFGDAAAEHALLLDRAP
jgi:hypothetical protein